MVQLFEDGSNFVTEGQEGLSEYKPIPPGTYNAVIMDSEQKMSDSGKGRTIRLKFQIISPNTEFDKHVIFTNLNLSHTAYNTDEKKKTMVDIAKKSLKSICDAVGLAQVRTSEELHGRQLNIKLSVKPASDDGRYGPQNEIKMYYPFGPTDSAPAPVAGVAQLQASTVTPAAQADTRPAWERETPAPQTVQQ